MKRSQVPWLNLTAVAVLPALLLLANLALPPMLSLLLCVPLAVLTVVAALNVLAIASAVRARGGKP